MNKRGGIGIGIVVAFTIFLIGMPILNILKPLIDDTRAPDGLDCENSSISDGTRLTCVGVDLVVSYFILIVLSAVGGLVATKFTT